MQAICNVDTAEGEGRHCKIIVDVPLVPQVDTYSHRTRIVHSTASKASLIGSLISQGQPWMPWLRIKEEGKRGWATPTRGWWRGWWYLPPPPPTHQPMVYTCLAKGPESGLYADCHLIWCEAPKNFPLVGLAVLKQKKDPKAMPKNTKRDAAEGKAISPLAAPPPAGCLHANAREYGSPPG